MRKLIQIFLATSSMALAQDDSLTEQIRRLQEQAVQGSRQAFQSMQQSFASSGTSMSLQETSDRYTMKLTLAHRSADEIDVDYTDSSLVLSAPAVADHPAYRQEIPLPHAAPDAEPNIQRSGSTIVVTIARHRAAPSAGAAAPAWTDDTLDRMQQLQQQMNTMFQDFFGNDADSFGVLSKGRKATFTLEEEPDAYIVVAQLPAGLAENMDITIKDEKLVLEAKAVPVQSPPSLGIRTGSSWRDSFTLPGPVEASGVTVQRRKDDLIIRLPKAGAA